jgi:Flp pilus assembly protein TadG
MVTIKNSRLWRRLLGSGKGASTIEFALVVTFLSPLAVGVLDFGMGMWDQMQVGNAARAGAQYAIANGWNQAAIQTAVTSATNLSSITATPAPTETCGCPNASTGVTTATCGSACAGGGTTGTYIVVNARASYSTIFTYPGISNPLTLSSTETVRIN